MTLRNLSGLLFPYLWVGYKDYREIQVDKAESKDHHILALYKCGLLSLWRRHACQEDSGDDLDLMGSKGLGKYLISGKSLEKSNPCTMGRARKTSNVG